MRKIKTGLKNILKTLAILYGYRHSGQLFSVFKRLLKSLVVCANQVLVDFNKVCDRIIEESKPEGVSSQKMRDRIFGLHALLPFDDRFSYSILIPVYKPIPSFFKKAVLSALSQTAPRMEVILGLDGEQPQAVLDVIEELKKNPDFGQKLRVISVDRAQFGGGISRTTNEIAKQAKYKFLLLMDHDDWIRPDLLYRYELSLRLYKNIEEVVLFCNEYKINEEDFEVEGTRMIKAEHPVFPYIFVNYICHCLLLPKKMWDKVQGLRPECDGAQDFDLCLRLDLIGAKFQNIPFCLYAWRMHSNSTAQTLDSKGYATEAGIRALSDYVKESNLPWKIEEGFNKTTYRAIPPSKPNSLIHVVIPFRNQKEMTLKAVHSVLNQKGVRVQIAAIDNGSDDTSIAVELKKLNIEVIRVDEPFNFSRLCNKGVTESKFSQQAENILFLNNDVALDSGAIEEMGRWVDQPKIGMVGARLHYPDGRIQHGGVHLAMNHSPASQMSWSHIGGGSTWESGGFFRVLNICDAVTGACLLIKKELFLRVGGFDEIWYPVAYSDTDLANKVRRLGLYPLYTPYAHGIHYESVSRGPGLWEEAEASYWQFRNTEFRDQPKEVLEHQVFFR